MTPGRKKICKVAAAVAGIIIVFAVYLAYSHYLTLKKALIAQISVRTSSLIGQEVRIKDLSLSPAGGINIHDLVIENPEGFEKGRLLKVKLLTFRPKYRELLGGRLSFADITLQQPEVTLRKDKKNRFNISEALRSFLAKKSTFAYRVDTVKIYSGTVDVYDGRQYLVRDIGLTLDHLSSEAGTKTLIKAGASLLGEGRFSAEGWAYLGDDPKKFSLSASLKDAQFSRLANLIGIDEWATGAKDFDIGLSAEGDTKKGVELKTTVRLGDARFFFSGKRKADITLDARMFLDIGADALILRNAVLNADAASAVQISGEVHGLKGDPSYDAKIKIDVRDLSAFSPVKGVKMGGAITSNTIRIEGKPGKTMPHLSGALRLSNVSLESAEARAEAINANITFSSEAEMAARGEAAARILRVGKYVLGEPAAAKGTLDVRGKPASWKLASSLEIGPFRMDFEGGNALRSERMHAAVTGNMDRGVFTGRSSAELRGIKYGDYSIRRCGGTTSLNYAGNVITLGNPEIASDRFLISADTLRIRRPGAKGAFMLETTNLKGSYPSRKIEIRQTDGSLRLITSGEYYSGDVTVSKGQIFFQDRNSGNIFGKATFDNKVFSLDVQGAGLFKGNVRLSSKGKTSGGPFPVTVTAAADNVDLYTLSLAASEFGEIPYRPSGELVHGSFQGTLESIHSVNGTASVSAKKITVIRAADKKVFIKDGILGSGATFRGKDLDLRADAASGGLSAAVTGTIYGFLQNDRSGEIKAVIPETRASDIRNTLWDVFPDKLLYAGLEGSLSADVSIGFGKGRPSAAGELRVKDVRIVGENNEYSVGPVNGIIPIRYQEGGERGTPLSLPSFDGSEYQKLNEYYAKKSPDRDYSRITAGSLRYGFRLLEDIEIWLSQSGQYLNIGRFGANIFGGRLAGSAVVSFTGGLNYRAGMMIKGMSLTRLCDDIAPIKGYISGKVDGTAFLKGTGGGMNGLIGRADFRAYSAEGEKTKISREFLQKIGGPSMQAYLGERPFDKGILSLYLEKGYLIFRELEISHTNFIGMTDLSVKVAPFNNRISIENFLETITEAAERAKDN